MLVGFAQVVGAAVPVDAERPRDDQQHDPDDARYPDRNRPALLPGPHRGLAVLHLSPLVEVELGQGPFDHVLGHLLRHLEVAAANGDVVEADDPDQLLAADDRNDGFLRVREIFDLDLDAGLVTLSACNTGTGEFSGSGLEFLA